MAVTTDVSFPRGGVKKALSKTKFQTDRLFKFKTGKLRKVPKERQKKPEKFSLRGAAHVDSADLCTLRSVRDGMLMLGRINEVRSVDVSVTLPNHLSGKVVINYISKPYTNILQSVVERSDYPEGYRSLKDLFKVGDYVPTKVLKVQPTEKNKLVLSLSPQDINSEINRSSIDKGTLLWGAVESVQEHGYVIDLGIGNCRAFLSKKNIEQGSNYGIGQLIWCLAVKVDSGSNATTVSLSALRKDVEQSKTTGKKGLSNLIPGMWVDFNVQKLLKNGLQGKFLSNFVGYINEAYLHPQKSIDDYETITIRARVLYTIPTVNLTYLSLHDSNDENLDNVLPEGTVCSAEIVRTSFKGLYLSLNKGGKGFVSSRRLEIKDKQNIRDITEKYKKGSKHPCRILRYDYMEKVYICTLKKKLIKKPIFVHSDLRLGQKLQVAVRGIKNSGVSVSAGKIFGFVNPMHLSDIMLNSNNWKKKFPVGKKVDARVLTLENETRSVFFTLKSSLVSSDDCLTSYDSVIIGKQYPGVVVLVTKTGMLVAFYGDVRGWIPRKYIRELDGDLPNYFVGQTVKCTVLKYDPETNKLDLSLLSIHTLSKRKQLRLGQTVDVQVSEVSPVGLKVVVKHSLVEAMIPVMHLTEHPKLAELINGTYSEGDSIENLVCVKNLNSHFILSLRESREESVCKFDDVKVGTILRSSIHSIKPKSLSVYSFVEGFTKHISIPIQGLPDHYEELNLSRDQCLEVRVTSVDRSRESIVAAAKLMDVFDFTFNRAVKLLKSYQSDLQKIQNFLLSKGNNLAKLSLGERVTGTVSSGKTHQGEYIVLTDDGVECVVKLEHLGDTPLKKGTKVEGVVLWIDYVLNRAEISLDKKTVNSISPKHALPPDIKTGSSLRACVIYINEDVVLVSLRHRGCNQQLAFMPTRLHENDLKPDPPKFKLMEVVKIQVCDVTNNRVIAVPKKQLNYLRKWQKRFEKPFKAVNVDRSEDEGRPVDDVEVKDEYKEQVQQMKSDSDAPEEESEEHKSQPDPKPKKKRRLSESDTKKENVPKKKKLTVTPVLSGAASFWDSENVEIGNGKDSDSDDEKEEETSLKSTKKKSLSAAERVEIARQEEERLRKIETELADSSAEPQTAEQFDRLVLSVPNSSVAWIKYISFHLQAAEIDKARAIAKKALSTIGFQEETEKFNVWIALLNLENNYGTKELFDSTLEEAARMNDSLKIYLQALHMLSESSKVIEFTELLNTVTRRYKQHYDMWIESGRACYKCQLLDQARQLMQRALNSLDIKQHINLSVQFALMESRWGDSERAEVLFEKILTSYPGRVDVWSTYVDMLIKKERFDIARNVLDRAVGQKLPARKMKTLFKKYVQFEEEHENGSNVTRVKQMAQEYVRRAMD